MNKLADILGYFLSIDKLDHLIGNLRDIRTEKFHKEYEVIKIYNTRGNISETIQKETNFRCYHVGKSGYCGTNTIIIPRNQYSEDLKSQLISKYDSFYPENN